MKEPELQKTIYPGSGSVPIPDPTTLTTQQLLRELSSLKEVISTRLDAMDKAVIILQEQANRSPTINEVFLKHEEKFGAIEKRFEDRKHIWESSFDGVKDVITKTEIGLVKQIDQQVTVIQTINATLSDKIADAKERLTLIEGRTNGVTITERRGFDLWGALLGGIGALISVVMFIVFMFKLKP